MARWIRIWYSQEDKQYKIPANTEMVAYISEDSLLINWMIRHVKISEDFKYKKDHILSRNQNEFEEGIPLCVSNFNPKW